VLGGQVRQPHVLGKKLAVAVGYVWMSGQGRGHGVRTGEAVPVADGAEAAGEGAPAGLIVSGKVARFAAAGPLGRNRSPFWPHAASKPATPAAMTRRGKQAPTRIRERCSMAKLYDRP
jgi:hypothetical protein